LERYGIKVVTPINRADYISKVIFDELCAGKLLKESKEQYIRIIDRSGERRRSRRSNPGLHRDSFIDQTARCERAGFRHDGDSRGGGGEHALNRK